ncbi:helix-turn-helix domain-containing protein [Macrococcoides canis]|uniref:Helix-turn-helix domain-containing protein n=1 Tax=Macrococcoides canis TaxID=1855823 RepID=A0AAE6X0F0_9STAP|nr:helix-turn-helix transcriptional regulator [Macrococcus canis]QIH78126.1 helix-turn-helix domain-containing protein [Macrococcus canis]
MDVYVSTGAIIKRYKKFYKLTTQELADKLNKSRSYISLVENNKEKPSKSLLDDIAKVFSELYKYDENHNQSYKKYYNLSETDLVHEHLYRMIRDELYQSCGFEIPVDTMSKELYKDSGRIEDINGENKILSKPYYDLTWLLEQNENNVYFRYVENNTINIVNITDEDRVHIKSVLEHIFKMKYEAKTNDKED